jgi:DNA modification methylase
MQHAMVEATQRHGLGQRPGLQLSLPSAQQHVGHEYTLYEGDCVASVATMPDNSIDLTISSPPFSSLYIYSDSIADMGNSASHEEFFAHLNYLIRDLFRVTKPGRLCCFHCKDLPLYRGRDGAAGLYDFPGDIVQAFTAAGWTFHSRITIWKDPVTEMQRTKNSGLLHKNFAIRGEWCRQGMADYVLVFRAWKDDMPDKQIAHIPSPGVFIGEQPPTSWRTERDYSIQVWQRYASPVWFDISQQNVLQYREARTEEDEKHICPLQLDVIERCAYLWSNPGEIIFDPFSGIGSTGYVALKMERQYIGCELKPSYVQTSLQNLEAALATRKQLPLFA